MPQIVNGCGTWYYGKRNVQQYQGTCRSCGKQTTLTSYDTRLFVVVVFIPIIPLSRKRIIEKCPLCTRHQAVPIHEWERAQKRAQETIAAYRAAPYKPDLADEALRACMAYRDLPAFLSLAGEIEKHLGADAERLCMVAGGYELFNRMQDSERLLRAAMAAKDDDETSEMLASCLLRQGRPAEAEPYLQHIIDKGIPDRVNSLYGLAQGYQAKGEHEKALAIFDQCEAINPEIAKDATFRRLRDASTRRLGSTVAVKPGEVVKKIKREEAWRRVRKIAPLVILIAGLAYGAVAWLKGASREVFLVNGLQRSYTARINGVEHVLGPAEVTTVKLHEGNVKVEMVNPEAPIPAETVAIHTKFVTRPFTSDTFVINPDGTALLHKQRVFYSPRNSGASREPEDGISAGLLQHFSGLDYPFKAFPSTITMDSHSDEVSRTGVSLLLAERDADPATVLLFAHEELGDQAFKSIVQRHLLLEPERNEYLSVAAMAMKPEELGAFLRPGLDKRPVRLHWHRTYQKVLCDAGHEKEIEKEYDALLAKEPQNKELLYLASRVALNLDKDLSLCKQSVAEPSPCPYGFYSLCCYYLQNGQFTEAADFAGKTMQHLPEQREMQHYCGLSWIAAGQLEKALDLARRQENQPAPQCVPAYNTQAYIASLKGQPGQVQDVMNRLKARLSGFGEAFTARMLLATEAQSAYVSGNVKTFVAKLKASSDSDDRLAANLSAGDWPGVSKELAGIEKPTAELHLLIYVAATSQGRADLAENHLQAALPLLAKGTWEQQALGRALAGKPSLPTKELLRIRGKVQEKAIGLAALGLRDPQSREACFEMARKLNFDRRYPHLLLKRVLDSQPAQ